MTYLYMDTTDHLIVGILNSKLEWLEYLELEGTRNSGRIHGAIFDLLKNQGLGPEELTGIIQNAGPGSYTGMRVSEGISQIFEWQGMAVSSFFHFEVPELLGIEHGHWLAKAFKNEFFVSSWQKEKRSTELMDMATALELIQKEKIYCHFPKSLEKDFAEKTQLFESTGELIFKNAPQLFPLILQRKSRLSPYYFRTLDQEFKVSR